MERVGVIGGCRTPFVRAGSEFRALTFLDLGVAVVQGALERLGIRGEALDELIFSTVLLDPRTPNAARELVLRSALPKTLSAHFVSNNCISGLAAVCFAADGIRCGRIRTALAGGSESMSNPALTLRRAAERFYLGLSRARSASERLRLLTTFRPGFLFPVPPSPKEPSTGLTMGEHCEQMAKEFRIARDEQDYLAYWSHRNAARAAEAGVLDREIVPVMGVAKDNIIRPDTTPEKLAKLKPVFDRTPSGSLTAGNSSALTDGASVVGLMSESAIRAEGRKPLGFIEAVEFASISPSDGLLMAPAVALPRLLKRAKLTVADIDLFEIHEAFAAQVLCNRQAWRSGWGKYADATAIGEIPDEKINPNGGSIALGHPFAATGGRLILSALNHLQASGGKRAVISVCAAGAMACAMLLTRE